MDECEFPLESVYEVGKQPAIMFVVPLAPWVGTVMKLTLELLTGFLW
jgi:hypothetical protein